MFSFETFRIILSPSSVKKIKQQCQQFKIKRLCDARKDSVSQRRQTQNQDRQPRQNR